MATACRMPANLLLVEIGLAQAIQIHDNPVEMLQLLGQGQAALILDKGSLRMPLGALDIGNMAEVDQLGNRIALLFRNGQ